MTILAMNLALVHWTRNKTHVDERAVILGRREIDDTDLLTRQIKVRLRMNLFAWRWCCWIRGNIPIVRFSLMHVGDGKDQNWRWVKDFHL